MKRFLRLSFAFVSSIVASFAIASSNGLVISQVYGGGGNSGATYTNDFIELFNAGNAPISLNGYSVQYASAAGNFSASSLTVLPNVTIQPGQYFLVKESAGTGGTVAVPGDTTGTIAMSATAGKVALVNSTTALPAGTLPTDARVVDFIGYGTGSGGASLFEGSAAAPTLTNTTADFRKSNGCTDTDNNTADFSAATPFPRNSSSVANPCGGSAPIVPTCPSFAVVAGTNGMGTASASDLDGIVNAVSISNQPAGVTLGTITPAAAVGGSASVPILVASTVPGGSYGFTLLWGNNQGQSITCSATVTVGALTPIYTIQGSGPTSLLAGQTVITQGVVTRVTNTGFYMQDPVGDGDPTTSDGIFVFTGTAAPPPVNAGDLARVSATVVEFNTGLATNADTASHTITELSSVSAISVQSSGNAITPVVVQFPLTNRDDLEKYEHMLVTLMGPLSVEQNFYDGRFGQLTLAALGRVETPTNRLRPGSAANALYADNKRRSIVLEDGTTQQDPNPTPFFGVDNTVRAGDTVPSITGVIDYGLVTDSSADPGSWRIIPTVAPTFTRANPRTTAPEDVGGTIRVASGNVDNFFTTFTDGTTASGQTGQGCTVGTSTSAGNCRGADNITEFLRQRAKVVAEIVGLNPDVMGIMELQNNGMTAIQNLVDAVNAKLGAAVYAAIPEAPLGGGTDAIKVGIIYKPSMVTPVGQPVSDNNPIHNRFPLAQTFQVSTGDQFTLVVNHLRSKGCSTTTGPDADQGDLQSCFNATRVQQAQATRAFVASLFPAGSSPSVLLVGDFNAYAMEDPIYDFTSNGYIDEIARFNTFGYSYQFDGSSGRLDHALTSPAMSARIKRAVEWHINADEPSQIDYNLEFKQPACATCSPDYYTPTPYRASDHDPIVIGVGFGNRPPPTRSK